MEGEQGKDAHPKPDYTGLNPKPVQPEADPAVIRELEDLGESWDFGDFLNADGSVKEPEPQEWVIGEGDNGILPLYDPAIMTGNGGAGKTTLALQMGISVALGIDFWDMPTRRMPVLFFTGEDRKRMHHRRAQVITDHARLDRDQLNKIRGMFRFVDCEPEKAKLTIPKSSGAGNMYSLEASDTMGKLERAAKFYKLIFIDPLAYHFEGNDNSSTDAYKFIGLLRHRLCKQHKATVVFTGHHNKASMGADDTSAAHSLGSVGFTNGARCHLELFTVQKTIAAELGLNLELSGVTEPKDKGRWVLMAREKCNGLPYQRRFLYREDGGFLMPRVPSEKPRKEQRKPGASSHSGVFPGENEA